jgi:hypothetical protein
MTNSDYQKRMKAVDRQHQVAGLAKELLEKALRSDSSLLTQQGLNQADLREFARNLEGTFLVHLFATFEAGLRDAWANCFKQTTHPPMRDLLVAVAARRAVPEDDLKNAHAVRDYRNSLVHEGGEASEPVPLAVARKYLCTFFSWLPKDW